MSTILPAPLTHFVGREAELARAGVLLADARLLTLTGPGGAGKTRLALKLASAVGDDFPDGVWFVDLSPLSDGQFVWDRVAGTLGVKEPVSGRTLAEAVGRRMASSRALVVLDNCEHLVGSAAEVAAELLAVAPEVKVIATSREPLAVAGEVTWAVPPLSEPDAVELFSDRARQARPGFKLDETDAGAVLSICRRLDGLPLAIELAAARARALDPAYIAAGLKDHLAFLPSGPRTAPQRQSTLAASFDWSHDLLSGPERALLRQLSVFAGGFDVEAALAVCPASSLELMAALTDRSLILVQNTSGQAGSRYRMLETVRQFAAEYLDEAEEVSLLRTRHRDYYLGLAELAAPKLEGPEQVSWMARLGREQDNLRAALAWSRDRGPADALVRMVSALAAFWGMPGQYREMGFWMEAVLSRSADVSPRFQARIRIAECLVALGRRSFGEVPALANEALALARAHSDTGDEAVALFIVGFVAGLIGGAEAMRPYLDEALPLGRSVGQVAFPVMSLFVFILLRWFQSDSDETVRFAEKAIAIARSGGDRHQLLWAIWTAGVTALFQGRLTDAGLNFETVVADGRESEDTVVMSGLLGLAFVRMFQGDLVAARAAVAESLAAAEGSQAEAGSVHIIRPAADWIRGWMALAGGNTLEAREILEALVDVARPSPIPRVAALPLLLLADAYLALGEREAAETNLDEAAMIAQSAALSWILGRLALIRAKLRAREANRAEAESLAHEALGLGREAGDQLGLVDAVELLARLAADQESPKEAVRLFAAAESQRTRLGYRFAIDHVPQEAAIAQVKQALGPDDFASAWTEGAKLSMDEAIAYAARGRGERRRPTTGWASLTPSELEVVRLVGQHFSNPEIAARLFVSRATVKTHLVHIFSKLGVESRSELAAEAIKHGVAVHQDG